MEPAVEMHLQEIVELQQVAVRYWPVVLMVAADSCWLAVVGLDQYLVHKLQLLVDMNSLPGQIGHTQQQRDIGSPSRLQFPLVFET